MTTINRISESHTYHKTPVVFNADNPVQVKGVARGYHWFASYGGDRFHVHPLTVALGYCLDSFALYERELLWSYGLMLLWSSKN